MSRGCRYGAHPPGGAWHRSGQRRASSRASERLLVDRLEGLGLDACDLCRHGLSPQCTSARISPIVLDTLGSPVVRQSRPGADTSS